MRRVVKIGGSLLLRNDLLSALSGWFASQRESESLVIVGGGQLIEAIRRLDRVRRDDPVETHWTCVDLLETTHQIVSRWFNWPSIQTPEMFDSSCERGFALQTPTLINVTAFYNRDQAHDQTPDVPLDWRTTTDTIAAILAIRTDADELVLLKSCEVDPEATIEQLAFQGVVDEALPLVRSRLKRIRVEKL